MTLAGAPPEMQRLVRAIVGEWTITEESASSPGKVNRGHEAWKVGPGGRSLIEEYRTSGDLGDFHGTGIVWFDSAANGFRAVWCDSANPAGCIVLSELGRWDGDRFLLEDSREVDGKQVFLREVFSDFTPSSFRQTIEVGSTQHDLKLTTIIRATR